jgi:hypothetical protein
VLLVTVPSISRIEPKTPATDLWRYTPKRLERLIRTSCPDATVATAGRGNVLAAVAFPMGLASEDLTEAELEAEDPYVPLTVCATVTEQSAVMGR